MNKILTKIKSTIKREPTYITWTGKRYNPNRCHYCDEIIGEKRFSFHKKKHFHKSCVKKWYQNKKRRLCVPENQK